MSTNDVPLVQTLQDIASRLPRYAKLSASLARAGRMGAAGGSPLTTVLGTGELGKLARWVPQLHQLNRTLVSITTIRSTLNEMQSEKADRHLEAAGLTRTQVDADIRTLATLAKRVSDEGGRTARRLLHKGAHEAGRATGKGLRALRRWRDEWSS